MRVLEGLNPQKVFYFFEEICSRPHGSGNVQAVSDYCTEFAKERNLWVQQDEKGNVIIRKKAYPGYENEPGVILQGHMDMVCEKTRESNIDFEKDGLELKTDGKKIWAEGTTLGGDDGIAVAYALAVLDSEDIPHPELEAIFTVDEEIGLLGAAAIDLSEVHGRRMINLDSEEEGIFLTSCAGGMTFDADIPLEIETRDGILCEIDFSGCKGGHSGTEIIQDGLNANVGMGRILFELQKETECTVVSLAGGTKDNAIPRFNTGKILVQNLDKTQEILKKINEELSVEFAGKEENLQIICKNLGSVKGENCLTQVSFITMLNAIMNMPNGVQHMSADVEGLVETSLNLGVLKMEISENKANLNLKYAVRSSKESAKKYLADRMTVLIQSLGGSNKINGAYPGWAYNRESELREIFINAYEKIYGKKPVCEGIHAGVECGLFIGKIPDMDCISLGPDIKNVHTAEEWLDVASVERTWRLLLNVLSNKEEK